MKWSRIDRLIYNTTKKPECYKEVRNPPKTISEKLARRQDARQIQFNKWSERKHIYSGSYLPVDNNKLLKCGWSIFDCGDNKSKETFFYNRKSTKQLVRYDVSYKTKKPHYHWYNFPCTAFKEVTRILRQNKKIKGPQSDMIANNGKGLYVNKYGEDCFTNSEESHIWGKE